MTKDSKKSPQTSQEKALGTFMGQLAEMTEKLDELKEFIEDHMGYAPDDINWGHVGTAGWFLEKLTELTDCAYKRGEYTE